MKSLIFLLISLVLISGCIQQPTGQVITEEQEVSVQQPVDICIQDCKYWLSRNISKTTYWKHGPCLLNSIPDANDWVCDIAHSPRQDVDNLPENQCSSYREGKTKHFVEIDENCNLIRAV